MNPRNPTPALLALALGYFSLGTISLAVVGLNAPIGKSLEVAPASVGLLVTVFALTFAVGAPTAPALLRRMDRKKVLLLGLALLTVGGGLSAVAPDYTTMTLTRVLGAIGAAIFGPASSAAGAAIVGPERRHRALATVFAGMTAASVLGVPLASFLGSTMSWRPALLGVSALSALALVLVAVLVPDLPAGEPPTAQAYRAALRTPGALPTVTTTLLFMAAQFTVYGVAGAYLAARFDATAGMVSGTLMAFGVVGVIGNGLAPRISEKLGGTRTITVSLVGLGAALALLVVTPKAAVAGLLLFAVWAFFSQMYQAPQQARLIAVLPAHPALILALNASALYLGMSLGSLIGSTFLPSVGATLMPGLALLMLIAAAGAHVLSGRGTKTPAAPAPAEQPVPAPSTS
ncbi:MULTISPECIES: MFS transporter [Kitasatospora]|uniref:MFS transporter n=1 Tax=Kitasatospora TaxID=2063 RepID=UPI0004C356D4|nr:MULTISPECIES: MFS transporter [unclassified Kitasatospora]WAL73587.1 MFS transporter [Kitasatospora sp. YST-16]WNW39644.1 MFS transporter [Streptomyces sp. Li-HN-5-13]